MSEYTPAPWHLANYNDEAEWGVGTEPEGDDVALVFTSGSLVERKANAHLIAAAPRMYDALEFIVRRLEEEGAHLSASEGRYMAQAWRMALEVLATARGES